MKRDLDAPLRGDKLLLSGPPVVGQILEPPRVWGSRDEPITDPQQLPEGWTSSETDLADDDVDGQITRCLRRLDENIMPVIFERRLAMYQQIKKNQTDMINSEPDSLSWEVVQRLDSLKKVQKSFRELGNDSGNTSNVEAIMVAYRSGDLVWDSNSVTFWVHGKLIGGPRKWHMDEFLAFTKEHGSLGVWVEGVDNYKPEPMNLFATLAPSFSGYDMHMFVVSVRNPNTWRTNTWAHTIHIPVLEDSGASQMKIFQSDRLSLEGMSGAPLPFTGTATFGTAAGDIEADSVILHVNLVHNGQTMLPHWIKVRSSVGREDGSTPPMSFRLSGIWLHHMLYCLSAPDNTGNMYVGTDLFEITTTLPPCDLDLANPPYQI